MMDEDVAESPKSPSTADDGSGKLPATSRSNRNSLFAPLRRVGGSHLQTSRSLSAT